MIRHNFDHGTISQTLAVHEKSQASNAKQYRLGFGQSPFPVPAPLLEQYRQHAHCNEYLPVSGYRPLREALAAHYAERDSREVDPETQVLVGPGSKELLYLFQLVLSEATAVYQVAPAWVSYAAHSRMSGRPERFLRTRYENCWKLTAETVQPLLDDPAPHKALVLNAPNNPTGMGYSEAEQRALAQQLRSAKVAVVSDEIYSRLQFSHAPSLAQAYPEGTIVCSGLSKSCSAGGWRLGYMIFPAELRPLCEAMRRAASETYSSASSPAQYAAVSVFRQPELYEAYWEGCRRILNAVCAEAVRRFRAAGLRCHHPHGAWYVFPEFPPLKDGIDTPAALEERLRQEAGVWSLGAHHFGSSEALAVRLCLVDFDGEAALRALPRQFTGEWLRRHCPRLLEAVDAVCRFARAHSL